MLLPTIRIQNNALSTKPWKQDAVWQFVRDHRFGRARWIKEIVISEAMIHGSFTQATDHLTVYITPWRGNGWTAHITVSWAEAFEHLADKYLAE